jgi:hypothetical protein
MTANLQLTHPSGALSVAESDVDRFLSEAEECLRLAKIVISPLDKSAWLELAEDWMKLARAARERDI